MLVMTAELHTGAAYRAIDFTCMLYSCTFSLVLSLC